MDYKKILIFIFQILLRILGVGLLILGLTGLPTIFSTGGVTTNIITLLLRLVNVLSFVIVGYGLVRMKKWSIFGLVVLIIISILIPFHNLFISTTKNIPQQSLSFSRTVFFIIVYLITLIFKNKLFSEEHKITISDILKTDKYIFFSRLVGVWFAILGIYYFFNPFIKRGIWTSDSFTVIPSRYFYAFFYVIMGPGLIRFKKWSIHLLSLNLFLSIILPLYNFNFNPVYDFSPTTIPNHPNISYFLFHILINVIILVLFILFKNKLNNGQQNNIEDNKLLNDYPKIDKNSKHGYLFNLIVFTTITVFICLIIIFAKNNNLNLSLNKNINISKHLTPTPIINSEEKDGVTHYNNIVVENYEIVDTSQNPVFSTGLNLSTRFFYQSPNLIRWKNYLIGINVKNFVDRVPGSTMNNKPTESTDLYNKIDSIRVYNLDSKEIFTIQLEEPIVESYGGDVVSQLLENTLYFGATSKEGFGLFEYKLDLPPSKNSKIIKLPDSIGKKIEKIGNIYITSACYEGCYYALFNPISLAETVLTRMNKADNGYDEERPEKLIGIDSRGRMIIDSVEDNMIVAVPLINEKSTIPLIKKDKLPTKIVNYSMVNGVDKILMLGESRAYIYDINQDKFVEIQINQEANSWRSYHWITNKGLLCLFPNLKQIEKETISAVDLNTNSYLEIAPDDCLDKKQNTVDGVFKELKLPDNYELKDATLEFQTYWRYL